MLAQHTLHDIRLQRKMSPQARVTATDENQFPSIFAVGLNDRTHRILNDLACLLTGHGACIGQHIEKRHIISECRPHFLHIPCCKQSATMNRLDARGIIIQDDHPCSPVAYHGRDGLSDGMPCICLASSGVAGSHPMARISVTRRSTNSALVEALLPGA